MTTSPAQITAVFKADADYTQASYYTTLMGLAVAETKARANQVSAQDGTGPGTFMSGLSRSDFSEVKGPSALDDVLNFLRGYEGSVHYNDKNVHNTDQIVLGLSGDDHLEAGGGDDLVLGAGGADYLDGDNGNDTITGGEGWYSDTLFGDNGNDLLEGNEGADQLNGGDGHDLIFGDYSSVSIGLLDGDVVHEQSWVVDVLEVGTEIYGYYASAQDYKELALKAARAFAVSGGGPQGVAAAGWVVLQNFVVDKAISTLQSIIFSQLETPLSYSSNDTIYAGAGDDTIRGGAGADLVYGDGGSDQIVVESTTLADMDTVYGGLGNDVIDARGSYGYLIGGAGDDLYLNYGSSGFASEIWEVIYEGAGGGYDTVITDTASTFLQIPYYVERFVLQSRDATSVTRLVLGTSQAQLVEGIGAGDSVVAGAGNDTLSFGADPNLKALIANPYAAFEGSSGLADGGVGDDLYLNANSLSRFAEAEGGGRDIVRSVSGVDLTLSDNAEIERIELTWQPSVTERYKVGLGNVGPNIIPYYWDTREIKYSPDVLTAYGNRYGQEIVGSATKDQIFGMGGNDTIWGNSGDDVIYGDYSQANYAIISNGSFTQYLVQAGADRLFGGDGKDSLFGGAGKDALYGGAGADELFAGFSGLDTLSPDADTLVGGAGDDSLYGGSGGDALYGGSGGDLILGYAGDDTLDGGYGRDSLYGGLGNDTYRGLGRAAQVTDEGGTDQIVTRGSAQLRDGIEALVYEATVTQSATGAQVTLARAAALEGLDNRGDLLVSGSGNDWLQGFGGNDTLRGGNGSDLYQGGAGNDLIEDQGDAPLAYSLRSSISMQGVASNSPGANGAILAYGFQGQKLLYLEKSYGATALVSVEGSSSKVLFTGSLTADGVNYGQAVNMWAAGPLVLLRAAGDTTGLWFSTDGKTFQRHELGMLPVDLKLASDGSAIALTGMSGEVLNLLFEEGQFSEVIAQGAGSARGVVVSEGGAVWAALVPQAGGAQSLVINDTARDSTNKLALGAAAATLHDISADGRLVVFGSGAGLLGLGAQATQRLYLYDQFTGVLKLVPLTEGAQNSAAVFSPDGRSLAFVTTASGLIGGSSNDTNNRADVVIYDLETGVLTRVSLASNGAQLAEGVETNFGGRLVFSADGTRLIYTAEDTLYAVSLTVQGGRQEADTLDGGAGADTLNGGWGDDLYIVDNAGDKVIDSGGTDRLRLTADGGDLRYDGRLISGTIEAVEIDLDAKGGVVRFTSSDSAAKVTGSALADQITTGAGADVISGGRGLRGADGKGLADIAAFASLDVADAKLKDTISAGAGNDTILASGAYDSIDGGAGEDILFSTDAAASRQVVNVEKLIASTVGAGGVVLAKVGFFQGNDAASSILERTNGTITLAEGGDDRVTGSGGFVDLGAGDDQFTLATTGTVERMVVFGGEGEDTAFIDLDASIISVSLTTVSRTIERWSAETSAWVSQTYQDPSAILVKVIKASTAPKAAVGYELVLSGFEQFSIWKGSDLLEFTASEFTPVAPQAIVATAGSSAMQTTGLGQASRFVISAEAAVGSDLISVVTQDANTAFDGALTYRFVAVTGGTGLRAFTLAEAQQYFTLKDGIVSLKAMPNAAALGLLQSSSSASLSAPASVGVIGVEAVDPTGRSSGVTTLQFNFAKFASETFVTTSAQRVFDHRVDPTPSSDVYIGGAWNETLRGGVGDDRIFGKGTEAIGGPLGSTGREILDGGAGSDTISAVPQSYVKAANGTIPALVLPPIVLGGDGNDLLITGYNVENAYTDGGVLQGNGFERIELAEVSTQYNTVLAGWVQTIKADDIGVTVVGNSRANLIYGGFGADSITGGAGDDTLYALRSPNDMTDAEQVRRNETGANDTLDGGAGNDRLYGTLNGSSVLRGGDGHDYIESAWGDDLLEGGAGNDTLLAYASDATLEGGAGNDLIYASTAMRDPVLRGGEGDDTLVVGDRFESASPGWVIEGGAGNDLAVFGGYVPQDIAATAQTQWYSSIEDFADGATYDVTLTDIERVQSKMLGLGVTMTTSNTSTTNLYGSLTGGRFLTTGAGNDTLIAEGSSGIAGATLTGGLGNDYYRLDSAGLTAHRIVEAVGGGTDRLEITYSGVVQVNDNIEQITATGGAVTLTGGSTAEVITGSGAGDRIDGAAGADTINGGAGNDTIAGGAGADQLDGGAGTDTLLLTGALTDYTFTALGDGKTQVLTHTTAEIDIVSGFEKIATAAGEMDFAVLVPTAPHDVVVIAAEPDDPLYNLRRAIAKVATFEGYDEAMAAGVSEAARAAFQPLVVMASFKQGLALGKIEVRDINAPLAETFTLRIATLTTSVSDYYGHALALTQAQAQALFTIDADGTVRVNSTASLAALNPANGTMIFGLEVTDSQGKTAVHAVEVYAIDAETGMGFVEDGFRYPDVTMFGTTSYTGTLLSDTVQGTAGHDVIIGDDLAAVAARGGMPGTGGSYGYSALLGADDSLSGNAGNDTLYGSMGNDTLDGGAGEDRLVGGSGADLYRVENWGDIVDEESRSGYYDDQLTSGDAVDIVEASVNWQLTTAAEPFGIEVLRLTGAHAGAGSASGERIEGTALAETLRGAAGEDVLSAGAGDDLLAGGAGNDLIEGGLGADTAAYDVTLAALTISQQADGSWLVVSAEGRDTLSGVEYISVAGQRIALSQAQSRPIETLVLTGSDGDGLRIFNRALAAGSEVAHLAMDAGDADVVRSWSYTIEDAGGAYALQGATLILANPAALPTGGRYTISITARSSDGLTLRKVLPLPVVSEADETGGTTVLGAGADVFDSGAGADLVLGGAGNDSLTDSGGAYYGTAVTAARVSLVDVASDLVAGRNGQVVETSTGLVSLSGSQRTEIKGLNGQSLTGVDLRDATGRFVLFETAQDLGFGTSGAQVYRYDLTLGRLSIVSTSALVDTRIPGGITGGFGATISDNGALVLFESTANYTGSGTATRQTYLRNLDTGTLTQISTAPSLGAALSGNGQVAVYLTATGAVAYSMATGTRAAFTVANLPSGAKIAGISDDGESLLFTSATRAMLYNRATAQTVVVAEVPLTNAALSDDGRYVAFASASGGLVTGVTAGSERVYLYDSWSGALVVAPQSAGAQTAPRFGDDGALTWLEGGKWVSLDVAYAASLGSSDTLDGGAGNDTLSGGAGDDVLVGGTGDDVITGGAGNDLLQGGDGTDTAVYSSGVVTALGDGRYRISGAEGVDTLDGVERVTLGGATGALSDAVAQAASAITLDRSAVARTLDAGSLVARVAVTDANSAFGDRQSLTLSAAGMANPNDLFEIVADGAGFALMLRQGAALQGQSYSFNITSTGLDGLSKTQTVTLALADGVALTGTSGNDSLTGTRGADTLDGGAGDDWLDGGAGNDIIRATSGNDTAVAGAGDDLFQGSALTVSFGGAITAYQFQDLGAGKLLVSGSEGRDTLDGASAAFADGLVWRPAMGISALTLAAPTALTLSAQQVGDGGSQLQLTVQDPNKALGEAYSFAFVDAAGGLAAKDVAQFMVLDSQTGKITMREGASAYFEQALKIAVQVTDGAGFTFTNTFALTAQSLNNRITGGLSAERFEGRLGQDTILGGGGDDTLSGGAGNDVLDGGAGQDRALYAGDWARYAVSQVDGQIIVDDRLGTEGRDTLSGIESLSFNGQLATATQAVAAAATGVTLSSTVLPALAAEGRIIGTLSAVDANSAVGDVQSYAFAAGTLTVAQTQALFTLDGAQLRAKAGVDYSALGSSVQIAVRATGLDGLASTHTLTLTLGAPDPILGSADADVLQGLGANDTIFGLLGDDTISGGAGQDRLDGGAGNDLLTGGLGNDLILGGEGLDTALYGQSRTAVQVTALADGRFQVVSADGSDTLDAVEKIEIGGKIGNLADAVAVAPRAITLSATNVQQGVAAGTLLADISIDDPNIVFGDTVSLAFADASGGLTAAQAASLFTLSSTGVAGQLRATGGNLATYGNALSVAIRATDADGNTTVQIVDLTVDRVNEHLPTANGGGITTAEGSASLEEGLVLSFDATGYSTDLDPFDPLKLIAAQVTGIGVMGVTYTQADLGQSVSISGVDYTVADLFTLVQSGLTQSGNMITFDLASEIESLLYARNGAFWNALPFVSLRQQIATAFTVEVSYQVEDSFGATSGIGVLDYLFVGKDQAQVGTAGDDVLAFKAMTDYAGLGGNDTIFGSAAVDHLRQLSGTVVLDAGAGDDIIDLIAAGSYAGGAGDDHFSVANGTETMQVTGGAGNDSLAIDGADSGLVLRFDGGAGDDLIVHSSGVAADVTLVYDLAWQDFRLQENASYGYDLIDITGRLGTDLYMDSGNETSGLTISLTTGSGSLLNALDQAPTALEFSTTTLSQGREGTVLAQVSVQDINAVFGDTASLSFVNRAGGLTAAQAASILRFDGGALVSASDAIGQFGSNLALRVRATDSHGLWRDFDVTLTLRTPSIYLPEGTADTAIGSEDAPLLLDLLANDRDLDAQDTLSVMTGDEGLRIEAAVLATEVGLIDLTQVSQVVLRGQSYATADLLGAISAGTSVVNGQLSLNLPAVWDKILLGPNSGLAGMAGLYEALDLRLSYRLADSSGAVADSRTMVDLHLDGSMQATRGTSAAEALSLSMGGRLEGMGGADTLTGSDAADILQLTGQAGRAEGAGGDDLLIGGAGDVAVYRGVSFADLAITALSPAADGTARYLVRDLRTGAPLGNDTVQGIDKIEVGGQQVTLAQAVAQAPDQVQLDALSFADNAAAGTVIGQINVHDANSALGDSVSLRFVDANGGLSAAEARAMFSLGADGALRFIGSDALAYGAAPVVAIEARDRAGLTRVEQFTLTLSRHNQSTPEDTSVSVALDEDKAYALNVFSLMAEGDRYDPLSLRLDGAFAPKITLVGGDVDTLRDGTVVGSLQDALQSALQVSADGQVWLKLPKVWADDLIDAQGPLAGAAQSGLPQILLTLYVSDTLSGAQPAKLDIAITVIGSDDAMTAADLGMTVQFMAATIYEGGAGDYAISGSNEGDVITLGAGASDIWAEGGDDVLSVAGGNSTLRGGEGNDTISVETGAHFIDGDGGDDLIVVQGGTAWINGGAGNDMIIADTEGSVAAYFAEYGWEEFQFSRDETGALIVTAPDYFGLSQGVDTLIGIDTIEINGIQGDVEAAFATAATLAVESQRLLTPDLVANTLVATLTVTDSNLAFGDSQSFSFVDTLGGLTATQARALLNVRNGGSVAWVALKDPSLLSSYSNNIAVTVRATGLDGLTSDLRFSFAAAPVAPIYGSDAGGSIAGTSGTDIVLGGAGNDVVLGTDGADSLDGGTGMNVLDYSASTAAVQIDLATGRGWGGFAEGDVLSNFTQVKGSAFGDLIQGALRAELLSGETGNDTVFGGEGDDTLVGGAGADVLMGGQGDDVLQGGADADLLDGGAGRNAASYGASAKGVNVDLSLGKGVGGDANGDSLANISAVYGSRFDDVLIGSADANELYGDVGNDTLTGGAGNDVLAGGAGNDKLTGGDGIDTVDYADATARVTVDLSATKAQATGGAGSDLLAGIENLTGSGFADVLKGSTLANRIVGGAGNDTITGGAAADDLQGGLGDDLFVISSFAEHAVGEVVFGDAGTDELRFTGTKAGTLVLTAGVAVERVVIGTGLGAQADIKGKIAINVDASAVGVALTITGNAGANLLTGTVLADNLFGGAGNDTIKGGAGVDNLQGGAGNDLFVIGSFAEHATGEVVFGDAGTDELRFTGSTAGTLVLSAGVAVERVVIGTGQGAQADSTGTAAIDVDASALASALSITGNAGANRLIGTALADSLTGGAGADTLIGGLGIDSLNGGAGDDVFIFNVAPLAANRDVITNFTSGADEIHLARDVMTGLGAEGSLSADAFLSGARLVAAQDATDRIIYNSTTGALYYDADGVGGAAAVQIMQFSAGSKLLVSDLFVF